MTHLLNWFKEALFHLLKNVPFQESDITFKFPIF